MHNSKQHIAIDKDLPHDQLPELPETD